jgi:hypothetical protein
LARWIAAFTGRRVEVYQDPATLVKKKNRSLNLFRISTTTAILTSKLYHPPNRNVKHFTTNLCNYLTYHLSCAKVPFHYHGQLGADCVHPTLSPS